MMSVRRGGAGGVKTAEVASYLRPLTVAMVATMIRACWPCGYLPLFMLSDSHGVKTCILTAHDIVTHMHTPWMQAPPEGTPGQPGD
jgi:hypothetical protein